MPASDLKRIFWSVSDTKIDSEASENSDSDSEEDSDSETESHSSRDPSAATVSETVNCSFTPTEGGTRNILPPKILPPKKIYFFFGNFFQSCFFFSNVRFLVFFSSIFSLWSLTQSAGSVPENSH